MEIYTENRICPKCYAGADTAYHEVSRLMERTCRRCGYIWYELPFDRMNELPAPDAEKGEGDDHK